MIIELDCTESTNNYAMSVIESGNAQHGMTITALSQSGGKGQRGNKWADEPGMNLLMSVILKPGRPIQSQFVFNYAIAVSVADIIDRLKLPGQVAIKWPNDIMINDKKAGGILVENVIRGNTWAYAVVGLGLNVNQKEFAPDLPHATSLFRESGQIFGLEFLRDEITESVQQSTYPLITEPIVMNQYNKMLYRRGLMQHFRNGNERLTFTIQKANPDGTLLVADKNGEDRIIRHGEYTWEYGG
jgi:BirA family transcriptional regulator, biotin operon repressor / biotin---[acetyl-CoA-carboxylase] ligase